MPTPDEGRAMIPLAEVQGKGGISHLGGLRVREDGSQANQPKEALLQEKRGIVAGDKNVKCPLPLFTIWDTSKNSLNTPRMAEGMRPLS